MSRLSTTLREAYAYWGNSHWDIGGRFSCYKNNSEVWVKVKYSF